MTDINASKSSDYHFSKISLLRNNLSDRKLMTLIKGSYYLHKSLWSLFPNSEKDQKRDFIYYVIDKERIPAFYVVSKRVPKNPEGIWDISTKPYSPKLKAGMKFGFSIRANPRVTRKSNEPNAKNSPKHDIFMDAKKSYKQNNNGATPKGADWQNLIQETGSEWMNRQGKRLGFSLETGLVNSYQQEKLKSKGRNIQFGFADFEGILRVENPDTFRSALYEGIGSSKAFGCGLLLIRRVS